MARRYHVSPLPPPGPCTLPPEVAHHVGRVLRARPGETIVLFDGEGCEAPAVIESVAGRGNRFSVSVELGPSAPSDREPKTCVELAIALPKGNRADWLFEHGTEVGVSVFHPIITSRTAATPRGDRWSRILAAATGQCDRARIPELRPPRSFEEFAAQAAAGELPEERFLAEGSGPALGPAESDRVLLLVGPEGGLTPEESDRLQALGFAPRSLGALTLRSETAALAGAVRLLQRG